MPMATGFTPAGDPHAGSRILHAGAPLAEARGAAILVHGRGASAEDILDLASHFRRQDTGMAWLAPQADGHTWYPYRFLEPIERNEPHLSSALALLGRLVREANGAGVPSERIALLGFSQGACLALEFVVRHPARYGAAIGLSGGLIGPPGTTWPDRGSLAGTPVFLGCSDVDSHIPESRVIESAERLAELGGSVDMRIYPGMGHTINRDELDAVQSLLDAMLAPGTPA